MIQRLLMQGFEFEHVATFKTHEETWGNSLKELFHKSTSTEKNARKNDDGLAER